MSEKNKYIAFDIKTKFYTFYSVDKEKIEIQICKNGIFRQPYSEVWNSYIKETCLKIYPQMENPLRIFRKLYNRKIIQEPTVKAFKQH
jgi:hypothetical protein